MLHFHKWVYGKHEDREIRKCLKCGKLQILSIFNEWINSKQPCEVCKGYGTTLYNHEYNNYAEFRASKCMACYGTGYTHIINEGLHVD